VNSMEQKTRFFCQIDVLEFHLRGHSSLSPSTTAAKKYTDPTFRLESRERHHFWLVQVEHSVWLHRKGPLLPFATSASIPFYSPSLLISPVPIHVP
jgi:hypothetical protein